ncbi:hypothetical protein CBS101457_006545 [Exobasidium rhododendri]|nr:hypothetical protein CBS101457_006545 [Exobasidium rhododendri]
MTPTGEGSRGKSVCLIGAGIMGITTAYYLAMSGRCGAITLLEEGQIAGGASGKAAGFLARDWHSTPTSSLGKLSYELHSDLAEKLDGARRFGYRKVSSLTLNVQKGCKKESQTSADPITSWMNPDNISEVDIMGEEGTAQVHPEQFCHALIEECQRKGVKVVSGRADSVKSTEEGHSIYHSDGVVDADVVVLCAGPWTGAAAKKLFNIYVPVQELAGHSVVLKTSKPVPPLAIFASVVDRKGRSTTTPELFSRPDGTIYIAGENSGAPLPPSATLVTKSEASMERLLSACKLISPLLDTSDAEIVREALCYRPVTPRGYPYLCKLPQRSNLYLTAGHGPWGISLGPGTGKIMSELILDGKATSADVSYLGL